MKIENIEIDDVSIFKNNECEGFVIQWSANIGFGEYTFYKKDGKWYADNECMSKEFGKKLLEKFLDEVILTDI